MTDQSLLLLENITYLNNDVATAAGVTLPAITSVASIADYLAVFDEDALKELEKEENNISAYMTGAEWAAIIRALKRDEDILALQCQDYNPHVFAACFTDPDGNAYVAFQGTANGHEWKDNVEGLNTSDTECQKMSLDYIESLPYDDITVVGHSKGGNKAMYVTITSDKVTHCVAMDGQGFSQEFLDKYRAEIEANGFRITNYSLDTDYVHILLFPIPGSNQNYYANGGEQGLRNHCPGAYYQYYKDADGTWQLLLDENGIPVMVEVPCENQGIAYLHDFTCFVINVMPDRDKQKVVEYLSVLLALAMGEDSYHIEVDGVVYTKDTLTQFIVSDQETLALVLAYVLKYADTVGLSEAEIEALLRAFGFGDLLDKIELGILAFSAEFPIVAAQLELIGLGIQGILHLFIKQLRDEKRDPIIEQLLSWLQGWLGEKLNVPGLDLVTIWRTTEKEYIDIGSINASSSTSHGTITRTRIYDYSKHSYNVLMQTLQSIQRQTVGSVSDWNRFAYEEWYGKIHVAAAINGINGYYTYLSQINENCKSQIDRIYSNVQAIDQAKANSLQNDTEILRGAASSLGSIVTRLG